MDKKYIEDQTFKSKDFSNQEFERVVYANCEFSKCLFSHADFAFVNFVECIFDECDFSSANIDNCGFRDAKFKGYKMLGLRFDYCNDFMLSFDFEDCMLNYSFDPEINQIKKGVFSIEGVIGLLEKYKIVIET